jgi:hypothetical protein
MVILTVEDEFLISEYLRAIKALLPLRNGTMVTKQRSDKRTAHISNRVRRNAPISSSMMPRGDLSSSMVRY